MPCEHLLFLRGDQTIRPRLGDLVSRSSQWLYVVVDFVTPHPRLVKVNDPFGKLFVSTKSAVLVKAEDVLMASESDRDDR